MENMAFDEAPFVTAHQMADEAIQEYFQRFGEQSHNEIVGLSQKWGGSDVQLAQIKAVADDQIQAKIEVDTSLPQDIIQDERWNLGHTECMTKLILQSMHDEENERLALERKQKDQLRAEYGIGWKMKHIPRNDEAASKLAMCEVAQGMMSLIYDDGTNSLCLASTMEPSAAVNLEYLSTSLNVRRTEGHEPTFSLDPADPDDVNSMQAKMFSPEWLAGTSVGEVLFQSDYHLKELSMGEFGQPIVGMKSCSEYSAIEEQYGWNAREWFLVRKAEVLISDSGMLIPMVKMGVEAREQAMSGTSLEDKPVTRADHPMVKYAEAFTRNFDLIAERRSVVYHLRELAKASVMAKFLLDSNIQLEEGWFSIYENKDVPCSLEVPQLWNERTQTQVQIKDTECGRSTCMFGVYGGVQFGLDKFSLSTSVARQASVQAGLSQHRLAFGLSRRAGLAPASYIQSMASGAHFAPPSAALSAAAVRPARLGAPSAALSAASITGAPRLATSIGVTPLASKLPPPSATLSATVAPRLATSIGVTKLTPLSAKFAPPSASLSATVAPRLATSIGAGVGMARAPSLSAKFAPPSATLSSTVAPRLATSIGAGVGMARAPALSAKFAPPSASLSSTVAPRLASSIGAGVGMARAPTLSAKFAPPSASLSSTVAPRLATSIGAGVGMARAPTLSAKFAAPSASLSSAVTPALSTSIGAGVGMARAPRLQGVDLRLDQFDLSEATRMSAEEQESGWVIDVKPLDECVAIGDSFFACLDGSSDLLKEDDRSLLQNVFHPALTDRRKEGDLFTPPSARHAYVQKLRALVKDEQCVRSKRKETFFSQDFKMNEPGSLFPHSWKPSFEIPESLKTANDVAMQPCSEYQGQEVTVLDCVAKTTAPLFDKETEEGTRFRIYKSGRLEVRTVQELEGEEVVGTISSEVVE